MKSAHAPDKITSTTSAQGLPLALQEQVRARAYELYEQRGHEGGHEIEDWLQAEQEVLGNKTIAHAA